jgi:hypothetical protein
VILAPGAHTVFEYTGGSFPFQVSLGGIVNYDSSLEGILTGQGTNQLTVNAAAITIDARPLSNPLLFLDNTTRVLAGSPFPAHLLPGSHTLEEYGGAEVAFTVTPGGQVQYDSSLEGVLTGQNSSQLTVNGVTITIDATALSTSEVSIDYEISRLSNAPFPLTLLPGLHLLESDGGTGQDTFSVNFSDKRGYVSYDSSLSNAFTGQGTATLTAAGRKVTIDTSALTGAGIVIDYSTPEPAGSQSQVVLLPGLHFLQLQGSSTLVYFTVNPDGTMTWPASEDNDLSLGPDGELIVKALS